jgi:acyl carrier protein
MSNTHVAVIPEKLRSLLSRELGIPPDLLLPESKMTEFDLDSLEMINLASTIEGEYGIEIEDEEFEKVQTLSQLVELIEEKGGE